MCTLFFLADRCKQTYTYIILWKLYRDLLYTNKAYITQKYYN